MLDVSAAAHRRVRLRSELEAAAEGWLPAGLDPYGPDLPEVDTLNAEQTAAAMAWGQADLNAREAWMTALAGHAEKIGASRTLHAGTTGTMVAAATGTDPALGAARVRTAAVLDGLPVTAQAYADGLITTGHVQVLADAHAVLDLTGREDGWVDLATQVGPTEVRHLVQVIVDQHNPAAPDLTAAAQQAKRGLRISWCRNGMVRLTGLLTETDGTRLADTLEVFTDPPTATDARTPDQRRADALADLAAAAAANTSPLGVSSVSLLVDAADVTDATYPDGRPVPAGLLDYHTCAAAIAVIFGTYQHTRFIPLRLGRLSRRATAAQWAALIARDRGCIRCGRSPRFCEAHHIVHWAHGGYTDLPNLALLCSRCHHDLHTGHYTITVTPQGIPQIHPTRAPPTVA